MNTVLDPDLVSTVKSLVDMLKADPYMLESPDLSFFKDYLISLGGKVPRVSEERKGNRAAGDGQANKDGSAGQSVPQPEEFTEPEEPFPELPQEGVLEADETDPNQEMGNQDVEVSDEAMEKSNDLKSEAIGLFGEGNFQGCVEKYTEAIKLNGHAAALFAKRGQAYLKLEKPNACIKDCTLALEINPDSAMAYKFRGRAHRLLGRWEEAAADLRLACKIDLDDQTDEWLKEVQPLARKVEEWRLKKKRRDEEIELKERKARAQERARAHAEAQKNRAEHPEPSDDGDFEMPGGLGDIFSDPEIVELLADPDVSAAFGEISKNPANLLKYQGNPKVAKLIQVLQKKIGLGGMGGGGGMPGGMGGMPGGMGGFPGFGGGMPGGMGGMPGGMGGFPGFGGPTPTPPQSAPKPPTDDLD